MCACVCVRVCVCVCVCVCVALKVNFIQFSVQNYDKEHRNGGGGEEGRGERGEGGEQKPRVTFSSMLLMMRGFLRMCWPLSFSNMMPVSGREEGEGGGEMAYFISGTYNHGNSQFGDAYMYRHKQDTNTLNHSRLKWGKRTEGTFGTSHVVS